MDGIGGGGSKQGWYTPSGSGSGPVPPMDGHANGWAALEDQIATGPHEGKGLWMAPIGPVQEHDCGPLAEGMHPGDMILGSVMGWDHSFMDSRRDFGGDGGLG